MKNHVVPICNAEFISKAINENRRFDNRKRDEFRNIYIGFGIEYGTCIVSLGNTKVFGSVAAEIVEPNVSRQYEGSIRVKLDFGLTSIRESERMSDTCIELQRLLEKHIKQSRCIDLEALCLVAGEKVWELNVNLRVLNADGNVAECGSVAAMGALTHFRRPQVIIKEDGTLHICSYEHKNPIPLTILHWPFIISFAVFNRQIINDPNLIEEQVSDGKLCIGSNSYGEITVMHVTSKAQANNKTILKCCSQAIERSKHLTLLLQQAIEKERDQRTDQAILNNSHGLVPFIQQRSGPLFGFHKVAQIIEPLEEETQNKNQTFNDSTFHSTKIYRFALSASTKSNIAKPESDKPNVQGQSSKAESADKPDKWKTEEELMILDSDSDSDVTILEPTDVLIQTNSKQQVTPKTIPVQSLEMEDDDDDDVVILSSEFK